MFGALSSLLYSKCIEFLQSKGFAIANKSILSLAFQVISGKVGQLLFNDEGNFKRAAKSRADTIHHSPSRTASQLTLYVKTWLGQIINLTIDGSFVRFRVFIGVAEKVWKMAAGNCTAFAHDLLT